MRPACILSLCLVALLVGHGSCCLVRFWQQYSMTELLSMSSVVVYGREIYNITMAPDRVDSVFAVSCVFRSDGYPIGTNITIESVWPRSNCSTTYRVYKYGGDVIVGLKRRGDNTFEWDERNPLQSIAYGGSSQNLLELATTCGLRNWTSPDGIEDTVCPLCGHLTNVSNPFQTICLIDQLESENCTEMAEPTISAVCTCNSRRPSNNVEVETGGAGTASISSLMTVIMSFLSFYMVLSSPVTI